MKGGSAHVTQHAVVGGGAGGSSSEKRGYEEAKLEEVKVMTVIPQSKSMLVT